MIAKNRTIWCVATFLWLGIMFFLSHQDGTDTFNTSHGLTLYLSQLLNMDPQLLHGIVRKAAHLVLYFVLVMLLCGCQLGGRKRPWLALVLAIVFSIVDEATKPLIPGRHCDVEDILLNDVGVVLGYIVARVVGLTASK